MVVGNLVGFDSLIFVVTGSFSSFPGFLVLGDWIIIQPSGVVIGDHSGSVIST